MIKIKISFVVPCYNEESVIEKFYKSAKTALSLYTDSYELVFINDGSTDATAKILKSIYNSDKQHINVIGFSRNFGKESAVYAGLKKSCGEYVTVIDSDLQQNPQTAIEMAEFLDTHEDYDCVAAYQKERSEGKGLTFFKKSFYRIINKISQTEFINGASDFRTFRRTMVNSIIEVSEYHRFSKGIFSWVGYNTYYVPYEAEKRAGGESKWSFKKLFRYAVDGIEAFTVAPLKLPLYIGTAFSLVSFIYLVVAFILAICKVWYSQLSVILAFIMLMTGIVLICFGIASEYLSKAYIQAKHRPIYIIKERFEAEAASKN